MPNKFSAGCQTCACPCEHTAASGSTFSDDFSSALSGWTYTAGYWQASGGQLQMKNTSFSVVGGDTISRSNSVSTNNFIRLEAAWSKGWSGFRTATLGMGVSGGGFSLASLNFNYLASVIGINYAAGAGTATATIADNGTAQITVEDIGGGELRFCFYLDGNLIESGDQTYALPANLLHGMSFSQEPNGSTFYGAWDDYKLDIVTV